MTYKAERCGCSYSKCPDWHVAPIAAMHGVSFTKEQAEAVAQLLNDMDEHPEIDWHTMWKTPFHRPGLL